MAKDGVTIYIKGVNIDSLYNDKTFGWINYFGIGKANVKIKDLDKWIRRRLRACIWKQWKR